MRALAGVLAALLLQTVCGLSATADDETGLTLEDAIVLEGVSGELDGIGAEHAYTDRRYPGWIWRSQALIQNGGRVYDVIEMKGAGGEAKSIYFDITDWFGKMQ